MPATTSDTFERLRALLQRDFAIPAAALGPDATLESLEVDSLRMIEVVFGVEEEFGVAMQADHNELRQRLRTLGDLAACIDELRASKPPG
jgi:acyl carrier protein